MNSQNNSIFALVWKSPELPTYLFIYVLVGLLSVPESFLLDDLDVCWLVRTGELIWQTGRLPETDIFSFTHYGKPWVLYQWGFEVFLGGLHLLAGLGGVVWGGAFLIALAYSLFFHFLLSSIGIHRGICIGLVVLTMLINSFHWLCRPNTASILFYIFLLTFLENYRCLPSRRIWFLPLFFVLWANVHLGFTSGLFVLLLYALWAFFSKGFFQVLVPDSTRNYSLMLVFLLCLLSTFINPYGPQLYSYLWDLSQASTMNARIGELHSPNFHSPLLFSLIIQIILIFWVGTRHYFGRSLILTVMGVTLAMGMYSVRHIPYFSIPATIHIAYSLQNRKNYSTQFCLTRMPHKGIGWGLVVAIISLFWVVSIYHLNPNFYYFNKERIPYGAASYLESVSSSYKTHRIFTSGSGAQWNDYLLYRLYPRARVFIDTRFDMYGDRFFKNYLSLVDNIKCDLSGLAPWKIDFLVYKKKENKTFQFKALTLEKKLWTLVYEDNQAIIYRNIKNSR